MPRKIREEAVHADGIRIAVCTEEGEEMGRAYLYLMRNDLHPEPFGLMEDVFVAEEFRGHGIGSTLVDRVIQEAQRRGCYKLIATSRYGRVQVHQMYLRHGFSEHGKEFRMDFTPPG